MKGKIKSVMKDKGFGFILATDGEYFFHRSGLLETNFEQLKIGDEVEFAVEKSPKGPRANNVKLI